MFGFDVNAFTYPTITSPNYSAYSADTVSDLAEFILGAMAGKLAPCNSTCANDLAAYLWSYRPAASESVTVQPLGFDEDGLRLQLACAENQSELAVKITDPNRLVAPSPITYFDPVISSATGLSSVDMASVVTGSTNDALTVEGGGLDIWNTAIYFSGLSTEVVDGQLDLALKINSATNVQHDFAKIGILASSTDDLSGSLIFLHWSGRQGIAEDSGVGALTAYRRLAANPTAMANTPTPTTLRMRYDQGQLRIGGCYDCTNPLLQNAVNINFEPKRVFVVVSSHAESTIAAQVQITDNFGPAAIPATLYETVLSCDEAAAGIELSQLTVLGANALNLEVFQDDALVNQQVLEREVTPETSCASQDGLLQTQIRRLSHTQIKNSLNDIFGNLFADDVWPDMEDGAKLIGMNTMADKLNINSINFASLYATSRSVVITLLNDHTQIKACADSPTSNCVTSLALTYGPQLWRRPLTDDELAGLYAGVEATGSNTEAIEFLFNSFILSSNFLFRSEVGETIDGVAQLNNYEIVSLLSFSIWNSTPDATLLTLAAQSTPITEAELRTQIERMLNDPRADSALMEVYKDFLKLDLVLTRQKAAQYDFSSEVRQQLLSSAERMLLDNIEPEANVLAVFNGDSFYVNDITASFFNTSSSSSDLHSIVLDSSQRSGILNHPAFLAVHSTLSQSGIVQRGVFTLEQLLCQEIPDPPANVMSLPTPDNIDPAITSERDLLRITHSSQSACVGCHQFIDPAGFGFENFDAVGRYRTNEKGNIAIDASGSLELDDHVLSYNSSAEFARALTDSPQMNQCVSQRFLEHYLSQELDHDACELNKFQTKLTTNGGSIREMLMALVALESFSKRSLNQ